MNKTFAFLALLFALRSPIFAADAAPAPANTLTWQDCVQMAVRNNPDLLSSLRAISSSQALYRGSYNGILPRVSLNHSYNRGAGAVGGPSTSWQLSGTATLDLIDPSQWASIESASAQLRQTAATAELTAATVLLDLYKSFAALLYAQEEIGVATSIRDTWKSSAEMVSLRYDSGAESKGNKMNTEASLLQAEANLAQAHRDIAVAQQQLGQAVGQDAFTTLIVTGTWSAPPSPEPMPDFERWIAQEPQIRLQQAVVEQTRAQIHSARSTLFPTLSLSYSKGVEGPSELPSDPFWTFTGSVNYPLFGSGLTSTFYAVQAAQSAYEKANEDLRSLRNQARTNLISAWSSYAQAEDNLKVQRAFLDAATQRKGESDINYQSGLMTFENWVLIVDDYVNSQVTYLKAEQGLLLAEAQWRFAAGEQVGEKTP